MDIDELFEKECWVIDFLPFQVKKDSEGRFFSNEEYFLRDDYLREKFIRIIIKINCYYDVFINDELNPDIDSYINERCLDILIRSKNCLITLDKDDSHMSIYNPDNELLELLKLLAQGEGLYLWRSHG